MATLAPSFFIGSSSFLQVTRTTIISRMGSNFSQIRPLTAELAALECLKNHYIISFILVTMVPLVKTLNDICLSLVKMLPIVSTLKVLNVSSSVRI